MKYKIRVEWEGYSRGYDIMEVEAENSEEALELAEYGEGECLKHEIIRDDIERSDAWIVEDLEDE